MKNKRTNKIPTSYIGSIMNLTKQILAIPKTTWQRHHGETWACTQTRQEYWNCTRNEMSTGNSSGRPRITSRSSSNAAITQANPWSRGCADVTMCARRGCTGAVNIRRPMSVSFSSWSSPPSICKSSMPCLYAASGGRSANESSANGVPQDASSSASPDRSTWVISYVKISKGKEWLQ